MTTAQPVREHLQPVHRHRDVVSADDGHPLHVTWYEPGSRTRATAVIVPAIGATGRFYREFATYLAQHGILTVTFDYRGSGSAADARDTDADLVRWGHDADSVLQALHARREAEMMSRDGDVVPLIWFGHSLGAQVLPLARHEYVDQAVFVATGVGYWRLSKPAVRRRAWLIWTVLGPTLTRMFGYFPGRRLRLFGDLPAGVMEQWARWCLDPDYFLNDVPGMRELLDAVEVPVTSIAFTDDELLTLRATAQLEGYYRNADVAALHVAPTDLGASRMGHWGFFRGSSAHAWDDWVLARLAPSEP